jgi:hypothetical protein
MQMGNLQQTPRQLDTNISEFLLDSGESAFDKREYLNAGGKKKKKKIKKVRKKKRFRTKDGLMKEVIVESEQIQNEDGTPLTKEEAAQNKAKENAAVSNQLKSEKIDPKTVAEVNNDKEESNSTDAAGSPKAELIFGMPKTVAYGGAAVIGVLFIVGIGLIISKSKKAQPQP